MHQSIAVHPSYSRNTIRRMHASPKNLHSAKSSLMYAFSRASSALSVPIFLHQCISVPFMFLHHRIIRPASLSSDSIPTLQISSDLILGQAILSSPISTGRPGSEFVKSVFALAEHLLHVQRPWLPEYCRRVYGLLSGDLLSESGRVRPARRLEILFTRILILRVRRDLWKLNSLSVLISWRS